MPPVGRPRGGFAAVPTHKTADLEVHRVLRGFDSHHLHHLQPQREAFINESI